MAWVLVIDVDESIRRMLCEVLRRAGYAAVAAADGREGMARFREKPADLVITDILMPEQEGLETISALRRDFPEVKIIAISGGGTRSSFDYLRFAQKLGAARTLAKPFTPSELLDVVREELGDRDLG